MQFACHLLSTLVAVSVLSFPFPTVAGRGRSLRQHVERRATLDTCATIDFTDLESASLVLSAKNYESCLDTCICLSSIGTVIQNNNDLLLLADLYGEHLVENDLARLVSLLCLASSTSTTIHLGNIRLTTPRTSRRAPTLTIRYLSAPLTTLVPLTVNSHSSYMTINAFANTHTHSATACAVSSPM
jgi:hypothetical protein